MGVISRNNVLYLDVYDDKNKRHRKSTKLKNTKPNRAKAEKVLLPQFLLEIEKNKHKKACRVPKFEEVAQKSFELMRNQRSIHTHKDYLGLYNKHIKNEFANRKIDSIKASELITFQNKLHDQGMSNSRIKKVRVLLHNTFNTAILDEVLTINPLDKVKMIPKQRKIHEDDQIQPFSLDEIKLLLDHSKGYIRNFIGIGYLSGMRSGELLGLKWSDIDFDNRTIKIQRSISKGVITPTKNSSSQRTIEILDEMFEFLQDQHDITAEHNSYVFLSMYKKPYHDIKAIRVTAWKKLFEKVSITYRNIYNLRHTFASLMISHGEDILWVSHMLGHSNSTTTLSHYAKYRQNNTVKRAQFLKAS